MGSGQLAMGSCEVTFTSSDKVVPPGVALDDVTSAQWMWKAGDAKAASSLDNCLRKSNVNRR